MAVVGNVKSLPPAEITQPTNVVRPPCSSADHGTGKVNNVKCLLMWLLKMTAVIPCLVRPTNTTLAVMRMHLIHGRWCQ